MGLFTSSRVKLTTGKMLAGAADHYISEEIELRERPLVIENRLGRGTALLVTAWEYPGDEGLNPFTQDLIRTVIRGEQADIRLLSGDRVRYAVCQGEAPGSRRPYSVVYLLNTDPDVPAPARLWVRGRLSGEFVIPPGEMRLAYLFDGLAVIPQDKRVDLAAWDGADGRHELRFFSAVAQTFEIFNLAGSACRIQVNGHALNCGPGAGGTLDVDVAVDAGRQPFFAPDFLEEPEIVWHGETGPY
jgi:hypothetical protein